MVMVVMPLGLMTDEMMVMAVMHLKLMPFHVEDVLEALWR